ncbi:MAG TPA: hypothetical protein VK737_05865 [Opitutales bacterium]|jgi:hypothetical protein|nr:hypothetical protein [Opitutales bacterium]
MKNPEHKELLREIFCDEELQSLREESLACGLSTVRSRRRNHTLRMAALAAVPMVVIGVIGLRSGWYVIPPQPIASVTAPVDSRLAGVKIYPAVSMADAPQVTIISDEELFALYKDQPVGLIGEPGKQRLVVYDEPAVR